MGSPSLTVIIPSYREPLLQRTIDDLRENAETDIEIIAVLDGYQDDIKNATIITLPTNRGMRNGINVAAAMARGTHIMKVDGHCRFAKGFDRVLLETIEDNWVVIPRRFDLNPDTWEVFGEPTDYEKLIIHRTRNKFHGERWVGRHKEKRPDIDETMMFQGSAWVMSKSLWQTIAPLDEKNYGHFVQEPVEIAMKVWQAGGKLMVNKLTYYAHKHRDWNRTHNVNREDAEIGNQYAMQTYGEYYQNVIKPRFGVQ